MEENRSRISRAMTWLSLMNSRWTQRSTLSGGATIAGIEKVKPGDPATEPAFNLIVADFSTYFVGKQGILVHDNTPRKPTSALLPGFVASPSPAREHRTPTTDKEQE